MNINDRVKAVRKTLKLTQTEFGIALSLKQNTITQIEKGKSIVTDRTVMLLCKSYNVNEDWLRKGGSDEEMFCEVSDTSLLDFANDHGLDKGSQSFLLAFAKMDGKKRGLFLATLHELLEEVELDGEESEDEPQEKPKGYHWEDFDIEEVLEQYRQELLQEKRARENSSALQEQKEA